MEKKEETKREYWLMSFFEKQEKQRPLDNLKRSKTSR